MEQSQSKDTRQSAKITKKMDCSDIELGANEFVPNEGTVPGYGRTVPPYYYSIHSFFDDSYAEEDVMVNY